MQPPWSPAWTEDEKPQWVRPYLGAGGLPATMESPEELGQPTRGVDLWQARNFVGHCEETHDYLYTEYTDDTVAYSVGTLPHYEVIVDAYTSDRQSRRERAETLLTDALPALMAHPSIPPLGPDVPNDRALDDRHLLTAGCGYCNEQARLFVRLCQVAGIPARIVFLFYLADDGETTANGHVVAEFATDEGWAMADTSYFCLFPNGEGSLLSAAACHREANERWVRAAYERRGRHLRAMSDTELVGQRFAHLPEGPARRELTEACASEYRPGEEGDVSGWGPWDLGVFGIQNYPLPPADFEWER